MTSASGCIAVPDKLTRWEAGPDDSARAEALARRHGLTPLLARILARRFPARNGDLSEFLNPQLGLVHSPLALRGMEPAVQRIVEAMDRRERIVVFGDYDVDGLSASALLWRVFRWLGHPVEVYIPNRLSEGYGLNIPALKQLADGGARLVITVDNGISAVEEIAYARSRNLDVIVTDHHQTHPPLPQARAIVNPNQPGCTYPCKVLSGVGVAFKVAHALLMTLRPGSDEAREFLKDQLDLVALGTVADVVPLIGENRILVKHGLRRLALTRKAGLRMLMDVAGLRTSHLTSSAISFMLAPRLNAAGRTDDPHAAFELLTTDSEARALDLARHLGRFNDTRRRIEESIFKQALARIESDGHADDPVLVLAGEDWSIGVLGLVAGRLVRQFYKPAICLELQKPHARGSCRSIPEYDIHAGLCVCEDVLEEFGGHSQAAGLSISPDRIPQLRRAIGEHFRSVAGRSQLYPTLRLDGWISHDEIDINSVGDLQKLEPYGEGNPEPVFAINGAELAGPPRGLKRNTLKFSIRRGAERLDVIGFGMADAALPLLAQAEGSCLELAFTPALDSYNGYESVILQLKALRIQT
ncbi:MAG: single-stranded-DNA-specific exonuclease RecJ [Candidatus Sumerlaeia bacterium]